MEARIGIITVSDSRTPQTDVSGPIAREELASFGFTSLELSLVRDEVNDIRAAIADAATRCDAIFTLGGTGFSPRDRTPEATALLLDRRADNLANFIRLRGAQQTEFAHLSRGIAGTIGKTLVVNLPGAPNGVRDGIRALGPLLDHLIRQLRGENDHVPNRQPDQPPI